MAHHTPCPGSTEPIAERAPDEVAEELTRRSDAERAAHAAGSARERARHVDDDESSYSTDQEQGAAQPGPRDV